MSDIKRVERVGPVIRFDTPEQTICDVRRAVDQCEECGADVCDGHKKDEKRVERTS